MDQWPIAALLVVVGCQVIHTAWHGYRQGCHRPIGLLIGACGAVVIGFTLGLLSLWWGE
jgi:hypothetical protein